jgi:hypothetical protein
MPGDLTVGFVLALAIDEGRLSERRADNLLDMPTENFSDLCRTYGIEPPVELCGTKKAWGDFAQAAFPQLALPYRAGLEVTVMGTTADKIAKKIAFQLKSNIVVDLAGHRALRQAFEDARLDADGVKDLISDGHDPCHAVYIFAQS